MIESDGFGSNRTRHLTGFRDPKLLTIGHPNRLYKKKWNGTGHVPNSYHSSIRVLNIAGSRTPATSMLNLFVTANSWKQLRNVTRRFILWASSYGFIRVVDDLYSNRVLSDKYSINIKVISFNRTFSWKALDFHFNSF